MSVNPVALPLTMQEQVTVSHPVAVAEAAALPGSSVRQQSTAFGPVGDHSPETSQSRSAGASIAGSSTFSGGRFDVEPNNSRSLADDLGYFGSGYHSRTFYGRTGAGLDTQDWTRIELGGRPSGTIQLTGMFQDLDVFLYDSSNRLVKSSINGGTRTDTISLTGLSAGTYFIRISPGVSGAVSSYALRFGFSVASNGGGGGGGFDVEPNNTRSWADNLGYFGSGYHSRTFYGSTGAGLDTQDWTCIELGGSPSGTIQLTGMWQDLDIFLYNSSNTLVRSSINAGARTDTISLSGLSAGTYFIRISPGVPRAMSSYALRFSFWA